MRIDLGEGDVRAGTLAVAISAVFFAKVLSAQAVDGEWRAYGHDALGSRYSPLTEIDRQNVAGLAVAWTYHTGEPLATSDHKRSLEVTPLMVNNSLYIATPLGKVVALDPVTGAVRWQYDAQVSPRNRFGDFTTRGVSYWNDHIYFATTDGRLIALDARDGKLLTTFGNQGAIDQRCSPGNR